MMALCFSVVRNVIPCVQTTISTKGAGITTIIYSSGVLFSKLVKHSAILFMGIGLVHPKVSIWFSLRWPFEASRARLGALNARAVMDATVADPG